MISQLKTSYRASDEAGEAAQAGLAGEQRNSFLQIEALELHI
jgi:hypothetical protein